MNTVDAVRDLSRKLTIENPLPGSGLKLLGRNKALRLENAGKLTISICGRRVRFVETTGEYANAKLKHIDAQLGYDRKISTGLIRREHFLNLPATGGSYGYMRLITRTTTTSRGSNATSAATRGAGVTRVSLLNNSHAEAKNG